MGCGRQALLCVAMWHGGLAGTERSRAPGKPGSICPDQATGNVVTGTTRSRKPRNRGDLLSSIVLALRLGNTSAFRPRQERRACRHAWSLL